MEDNVLLLSLSLISKGCKILGNKRCSVLIDVRVGNLKHVFRLFQCFSDSSDHAESYTIYKYTHMRVHIPPTQTITWVGWAEIERDRDSKEMEIKIER